MSWTDIKAGFARILDAGNILGAATGYFTVASAVIGFLVKHTKPFRDAGYGWADAAIIGIFGAIILAVVAGISFLLIAIAYRWLRPVKPVEVTSLSPTTPDNAVERIDRLLERERELEDEASVLRSLSEKMSRDFEDLRGDLVTVTTVASEALKSAEVAQAKADHANSRAPSFEALEKATDRCLLALRAVGHREKMIRRVELISESVAQLDVNDPIRFSTLDWDAWGREEQLWRRRLEDWLDYAVLYDAHARERIYNTPEAAYLSGWTFDEKDIPNHANTHRYKTYRIIKQNYESHLGNIMGENFKQAYGV